MSDNTTSTADKAPAAKDDQNDKNDNRMLTFPTRRDVSQEEYTKVVDTLVKDLKPYQVDLLKTLRTFNEDSATKYDFPPTLTSNERQTVHYLADIFGMTHESSGKGQKRFIRCEKRAKTDDSKVSGFTEMYYFKKYIGLMGPCVDAFAAQAVSRVPAEYAEARVRRDGPRHHITIITKQELIGLLGDSADSDGEVDKFLKQLGEAVKDNWEDKGLGRVSSNVNGVQNEVYYKILQWDDANKYRQKLGLPEKHFHITLGFKTDDIHDVDKGLSTLVTQLAETSLS